MFPGVFVATSLSLLLVTRQPTECADVDSCRQAAVEAADRQDFEAFHDLAWRAVQKGRRNDPDLMLLLARAQSLSGRPGDALVMLRRLTEMGFVHPAAESPDFERVRALPGWTEVEVAMVAVRDKQASEPVPPARPQSPRSAAPPNRETPAAAAMATTRPEPSAKEPSRTARPSAIVPGEEAVRLPAAPLQAIGLAYDSVSRRFVLGDRQQNRLIVADEVFKHVNDLLGASSGGFGALTAVEIDRRRGDLWVTSAGNNGSTAVHRLQLVSGRVLTRVEIPDEWLPATITDLAITEGGQLLLVDSARSRLLELGVSTGRFGRALPLDLPSPCSLATNGSIVYVSHAQGLSTVDLATGRVAVMRAANGVTLIGLRRIRWHQGSLVAIQDDETIERARLVRIGLGRSRTSVSRLDVLDDQVAEDGSVLTVSGNDAFYLARTSDGPSIRRVRLR